MSRLPSRRLSLLALPLALGLSTGCIAVAAGVGVGYVVSQQVLPGAIHESQVADDVEAVWESVKETAEILTDVGAEMQVDDFPRRIRTKVDGAEVTIEVEAHDLDRTMVRVHAEALLGSDDTTAEHVMDEVLRRLRIREKS